MCGSEKSWMKKKETRSHQSFDHPSIQLVTGNSLKNRYRNKKTNHVHSTNNLNDKRANSNPLIPDGAFCPDPVYRPPPKPIKQNMIHAQSSQSSNINNNNSDINFDLEENSLFQEGIMSETFQTGQIIFSRTKRVRSSYK